MLRTDTPKTDRPIQSPPAGPVALPTCAEFPDQKLIESAVSHIRIVLAKTVGRAMDEIGRHLLRHFYGDDPKLYFSANSKKHISLRHLMERCESMELPVSRTFLANALRMAVMARALPRTAAFHKLPSTHQLELLRLKNPESVEFLASKALSQQLTVRKLRDFVDQQLQKTGDHPPRGRRRKPRLLHAIGTCLQVLWDDQANRTLVTRNEIRDMTASERARAQDELVALRKCLSQLRRLMK